MATKEQILEQRILLAILKLVTICYLQPAEKFLMLPDSNKAISVRLQSRRSESCVILPETVNINSSSMICIHLHEPGSIDFSFQMMFSYSLLPSL